MDATTFRNTAQEPSTWGELKKDFDGGECYVACYQKGNDIYYASTPKTSAIRPMWLLVMARSSRKVFKGVDVLTNYASNANARSNSETGIMQLTLDNSPKISKTSPLGLTAPTGGVFRISLDRIQAALAAKYKVPDAKKALVNDIQSFTASVKDSEGNYATAGTHTVHRLYLAAAFLLLRKKHQGNNKDGVVALVVDKTGNIVSWGMKNPDVSCWHGETSALMALGGVAPAGGCVFSTLKPCKMCAGLIVDSGASQVKAYYGQDDPGDDADNTALDRTGLGKTLDAHKAHNMPYGLMVKPASTAKATPLGSALHSGFSGQKGTVGGIVSPIEYVNSPDAVELMAATEEALKNKIKKYKATDVKLNPNTKQVVEYLADFLRLQGISLD